MLTVKLYPFPPVNEARIIQWVTQVHVYLEGEMQVLLTEVKPMTFQIIISLDALELLETNILQTGRI